MKAVSGMQIGVARCEIQTCRSPHDDVRRCYYNGDAANSSLHLCRDHRLFFSEYQEAVQRNKSN